MRRSWLCRIGIHKWRFIGMSLFGDHYYVCGREECMRGKQEMIAGATLVYEDPEGKKLWIQRGSVK